MSVTETIRELTAKSTIMPIVVSIKPKWLNLITSGRKTAEVRKSVPRKYFHGFYDDELCGDPVIFFYESTPIKMVTATARFRCYDFVRVSDFGEREESETCLTKEEFAKYAGNLCGTYLCGAYLWRISDVFMLDKPVTLAELGVVRAPQSWMYLRKWLSIER